VPVCVKKFLAGEGMAGLDSSGTKLLARYHTPGSGKGWLIVETDNAEGLYHHASHWGEHITWQTHPVLPDASAAKVCAAVHHGGEAPSGPIGKLVYFSAAGGRGEPIRFLLRLAGVDFEDEMFTLADFGNPDSDYYKRKAAGEFATLAESGGGLPIWIENGKTYQETNAILRFLGARYGFYSTNPETMYEIDICMEKVEQVFKHAALAQHSHVCLAEINKAAFGTGDGPTEEQIAAAWEMYKANVDFGEAQLNKHAQPFLAGTDNPTIADFRFVVQFSDSIYNPATALTSSLVNRVKEYIATKPAFKKWVEETIVDALKGVHTQNGSMEELINGKPEGGLLW
jgi:glutathione S-transferase